MCSQETVQKTEFPPPTSQELQMQSLMINGIMPAYLSEAGYEMEETKGDPTASPKWAEAQDLRSKVGQVPEYMREEINKRADQLENEARSEAEGQKGFKLRKRISEKAELMRRRYGENSEEYQNAVKEAEQFKVETEEAKNQLTKSFLQKTQKFLNGDFSITESQRNLIEENLAPQRKVVDEMFGDIDQITYETFIGDTQGVIDKSSGANLGVAVEAAGSGKMKGLSMMDALTSTIEANKELLKMGIEDASGEITKRSAEQAAAMGRDPGDPEYKQEIQQSVAREVQRGQLQLSEMEARGKLGIAEQLGQTRLQTARQKGAAKLGLEEQAANLRFQVGGGMAPQQVGLGQSSAQFLDAQRQQQLMNLQGGFGMPAQIAGQAQALRLSQPTSTQTTGGSVLGGIAGLVSGAAGIYGGVQSAGASRAQADYYRRRSSLLPEP